MIMRASFGQLILFVVVVLFAGVGCRPHSVNEPNKPINSTDSIPEGSSDSIGKPEPDGSGLLMFCTGDYTENVSLGRVAPWNMVKFGIRVGDDVDSILQQLSNTECKLYLVLEYTDVTSSADMHYVPACWQKVSAGEAMADTIYGYTKRVLKLVDISRVEFVQISRCVSSGLMWYSDDDILFPSQPLLSNFQGWKTQSMYLNAASKAIREVCPAAKIVLQTDKMGATESLHRQMSNLLDYWKQLQVDYDVLSIYYAPIYKGALSVLESTFQALDFETLDGRNVHIETFYPCDNLPEVLCAYSADKLGYPYSKSGQKQFLLDCKELITSYLTEMKSSGGCCFIYRYAASEDCFQLKDVKCMLNE